MSEELSPKQRVPYLIIELDRYKRYLANVKSTDIFARFLLAGKIKKLQREIRKGESDATTVQAHYEQIIREGMEDE